MKATWLLHPISSALAGRQPLDFTLAELATIVCPILAFYGADDAFFNDSNP